MTEDLCDKCSYDGLQKVRRKYVFLWKKGVDFNLLHQIELVIPFFMNFLKVPVYLSSSYFYTRKASPTEAHGPLTCLLSRGQLFSQSRSTTRLSLSSVPLRGDRGSSQPSLLHVGAFDKTCFPRCHPNMLALGIIPHPVLHWEAPVEEA